MLSLLKNPFFKKCELGEVLLTTEHIFTRLFLGYKRKPWLDAFQHIGRMLRLALPEGMYFHVLSCSLTLIRDEYGVFAPQEKLQVIAKILSSLDAKIDLNEKGRAAFILLIKSALLRWRGRFERGANQRNTYAEALRCSEKSFELSENPGCLLQKALVNYSSGLAFQFNEAPKHEPFFKACFDIMDSAELAEFPSAIKYRPRLYRETYRFSDSIRAFWEGASQYPAEFKRIAYVLGEAASGEYNHEDKADTRNLSDAKSFLEQAIREGYHHGRNLISYVGCRGILEPNWFQTTLLDNVMDKDGLNIEWEQIIVKIRDVIYDPHDKYDEPGFGVDSGEFWATLGGVTGRILRDHGKAIRLLRIAEHHAEVSSGKFRAYLGLALQYKEIGDAASHKVYIGNMQTVARAHQKQIVDELEKLVKG
jgi:tetratricopeptide (TPR) repeat protein